jgi:hypothetical protein
MVITYILHNNANSKKTYFGFLIVSIYVYKQRL